MSEQTPPQSSMTNPPDENQSQKLHNAGFADCDQSALHEPADMRANRVAVFDDDFATSMLAELPDVLSASDNTLSDPVTVESRTVTVPSFSSVLLNRHIARFTINPWSVATIFVGLNIYYYFTFILGAAFVPRPQSERGFQSMAVEQNGQEQKFAVFVPHTYEKEKLFGGLCTRYKRPPVLLFLGGVGGDGLDGIDEFKKWLGTHVWETQRHFPFVVVAPQGDRQSPWIGEGPNFEVAMRVLKAAENALDTDRRRVYLIGLSFGGDGVWEFSLKRPGRFAAIAPSDAFYRLRDVRLTNADLAKLKIGIWCAYNAGDRKRVVDGSIENQEYLNGANFPGRFTSYLSTGHESHAKFYREPELYTWLLEHQLKFDPQTD